MRSLRPVSMVAWVFACHLRPCFGQLYQKEYTISARKSLMGKRALETNYFICQQCMIDAAGVAGIWMTHFSDRRNLAAFSITGTLRSFGRVHTYCEAYCDGLQELPPSPGMSTSDENLNRQEQNANLRASDQSNGRLLCLAQPQWSVSLSCRTCLKETSESVSFGEFYVVAGKDIRYVVYVLHSVRTRKQVYEPCITFGHCAAFNEEIYSEKVCERVHGSQALWYTEPIKSLEKAIASMKVSNDGQIEESPNGPESYTHFQCFKTTKRTDLRKLHQLILNCMKCLTKKFFGLVHCMTPGSTRDPDALFLIYFHEEMSVEVSSSQICRNKCPDFEPVETEECYKKYHFGFDWSPAENQMSVNVPELSRKNDHTVDGTLCVLAYSNTDIGACGACLNSQFKNEKHKARTLSKMNALIRIHAKKKNRTRKMHGRFWRALHWILVSVD